MNNKVIIAIVVGIAMVIGVGFAIGYSNELDTLGESENQIEVGTDEGKQFTLELSDSVSTTSNQP